MNFSSNVDVPTNMSASNFVKPAADSIVFLLHVFLPLLACNHALRMFSSRQAIIITVIGIIPETQTSNLAKIIQVTSCAYQFDQVLRNPLYLRKLVGCIIAPVI